MKTFTAQIFDDNAHTSAVNWGLHQMLLLSGAAVSSHLCVHTGCMCSASLIRHGSGDPDAYRENTQDFYLCQMHNAAIQHSTGRAGWEVGRRNTIKHLVYF